MKGQNVGRASLSSVDVRREIRDAIAKLERVRREIVQSRRIQDPAMTDAEFWHRKSLKPDNPNIGLVEANVNLKELIGGFWRYRKRTEPMTMAAARFKSLHEACQLGGAKAADYESPLVDTSFGSTTLVLERGEEARRKYREAVQALGMRASNLLEQVIIYDMSQVRITRAYGYPVGRTGRRQVEKDVYAAADHLALHFRY